MILEYHRAKSIEDAVSLLQRSTLRTLPIGGGTHLSALDQTDLAVVDLQDLNINTVKIEEETIALGATLSLQKLSRLPEIPDGIRKAITRYQNFNLRQVRTVAGELIASDGRSPLSAVFLAAGATLKCLPPQVVVPLEDVLLNRSSWLSGKLITEVMIPKSIRLTFEAVSRAPTDTPMVMVAVCQWPSGRVRVVTGGFGKTPVVICDRMNFSEDEMIDVKLPDANDDWASSEYREAVTEILIQRAIQSLRA